MAENPEHWEWKKSSKIHREMFKNLVQFGQENEKEVIKLMNGVRVCCLPEFCIDKGSDGNRVYVGLEKGGDERAVKRFQKDAFVAKQRKIFDEVTKKLANNLVRYRFFDDQTDKIFIYLVMDLCEETLESYVKRKSLDKLKATAPEIIYQVLKGLADLHREPTSILHRDLKPSNILRDVDGNWLLADFDISRVLPSDARTHKTKKGGTRYWRAVESCPKKGNSADVEVSYKKESDIQVAGMVGYYVVTQGQYVFGEEADRLRNLLDDKPVGLDSLSDPHLKDLLSRMLSKNPNDRPSAEDALKHRYLQTVKLKEKFKMLCIVENKVETKDVPSDMTLQGDFRSMEHRAQNCVALTPNETDKGSEETSGDDSLYMSVHEILTEHLNDNCELAQLEETAEFERTTNNEVEVSLICLWILLEYDIRKGDHRAAEEKLNNYKKTLALSECSSTEMFQFEAAELYLRCLLERSKLNYDSSYKIANESLEKIEKLRPNIVLTEFYALAATVANILATRTEDVSERDLLLTKAKELFDKAQSHLENVHISKAVKADIEQKVYTNLTIFHSGSCLAGYKLTDSHIPIVDEKEARKHLDKIHGIVTHENNPLSAYRETQHHLALSDRVYLLSKSEETMKNLKKSLDYAKKARNMAKAGKFPEMHGYARNRVELVQAEIANEKRKEREDAELKKSFMEKTFLDDEYNIKKEVHEKFESFSWLRGYYKCPPNNRLKYVHIQITIERNKKETEVYKEIEEAFRDNDAKFEAKHYFELVHKQDPKVRRLCRPASGGGIVAVNKPTADDPKNPLRIPDDFNDDDEEEVVQASGTLTLFCYQNERHYALTCFHVGCVTDTQRFQRTFRVDDEDLLDIHKGKDQYTEYAENKQYYYLERGNNTEPGNYTRLGNFNTSCLDSETDIMSIEVPDDIEIDCKVAGIHYPNWAEMWQELHSRTSCPGDQVQVEIVGQSSNKMLGHIVKTGYSFKCGNQLLFQNAILIKGNKQNMLEFGTSGALVCLHKKKEKQPFAYIVGEVDEDSDDNWSDQLSFVEDSDEGSVTSTSSEDSSENGPVFSEEDKMTEVTGEASGGACALAENACDKEDANWSDSDDECVIFREEFEKYPCYICLRLDTALKSLGLLDAACFSECCGNQIK